MDIKHGEQTLIILKSHEEKDLLKVGNSLSLHPLVISELSRPTLRPKVENFDTYLYLVLHFPIFDPEERRTNAHELDIVITKNTLLIVEYDEIKPLRDFCQKLFQEKNFRDRHFGPTIGILFHSLISSLFNFTFRELDHVKANIQLIDGLIFLGKEKEVVKEISFVRRDLLGFALALRPQRLPLESLKSLGKDFFGKEIIPYLDNLIGEYTRIWNLLETYQETLQALHQTNESLLSTKTNEIMKTLTVITILILPASVIATIFGMNTHLPFVGRDYDFWMVLLLMGLTIIATLFYFKKKKWL